MQVADRPALRELQARVKNESPIVFDVVRHGATALNGESNVSVEVERSWSNAPLTPEGEQQALDAGLLLKGRGITAIISSDLNRAQQTAEIIGQVLGIKPQFSFMLRPWGLGILFNREMREVNGQIAGYVKHRPDTPVPEGESYNQYRLRAFDGISSAVRRNSGKVVIVAHHRIERLLAAWRAKGYPVDHSIDIDTFLKDGDPPGGVVEFKTHRQLLNGEIDDKLIHAAVDYMPGHGKEFCRTCKFSDHQTKPNCVWVRDIRSGGYCRLWSAMES